MELELKDCAEQGLGTQRSLAHPWPVQVHTCKALHLRSSLSSCGLKIKAFKMLAFSLADAVLRTPFPDVIADLEDFQLLPRKHQ